MSRSAYRIKPYSHPKLKWVVRSKVGERWERKFFETKGEAETYAQQKEIELLNQGREGVQFPSWLRVMAQQSHERLNPFGKTISDAVEFYIKHLTVIEKSVTLEQGMNELIAGRKATGASVRYCNDLKLRLSRFCKEFPKASVAEITTKDVDSWLAGLGLAPVTRNTFRRDLRTLFSFCITRGYCTSNPATNARKAKEIDGEVGILSVDELSRLLKAASTEILPYLAIGAFAGLRSAELQRLTWNEIDLESKLIEVKASKSKTARRRFVKIRPNLERWLSPLRQTSGRICPMGLRKLELETRKNAQLDKWPPNALRHGFASYHLAKFNNAAELALEMGHTNQQMIFDHYRQLVKPKEASRYWEIAPEKKRGKVTKVKGQELKER